MPKAEAELLVINKMYDLVIWGCHRIAKFPRDRRYTFGDRLESRLYCVRLLSPVGTTGCSQGRQPLVAGGKNIEAPEG